MSDNKNIERFFQEKFKDFDVNPEPQAWENIALKLKKKKSKKRIFPFWFTIGGIAASFIIGYFVFNNFSANNSFNKNEIIVNSDDKIGNNNENSDLNNVSNSIESENKLKNSEQIVLESKEKKKKNSFNNQNTEVAVSSVNNEEQSNNNVYKKENNIVVVSNNKKYKEDKISVFKNKSSDKTKIILNRNKNVIASNKNQLDKQNDSDKVANKSNTKKQSVDFNNDNNVANKSDKKGNENDSNSNKIIQENFNDTKIVSNELEKQNSKDAQIIKIENQFNTSNQEKTVAENNEVVKIIVPENELDKILKEKEKEKKKTPKLLAVNSEKWKIRPNVAPIFMEATNGSPIHDIFADNKKEFNNKLSIGLAADYAITRKFSIRAGVNKFDLSYNTNEIAYYTDLTAVNGISSRNSIQTIALKDEFHNIVIGDKQARGVAVVNPPTQTPEEYGYLNQKFGYIEFPVEVSYKLVDKKFGITLISGLSTLLLNNNEVSIVSNNKTMVLGDVNNLNKIHYSTNVGIGFKYSFWKSFEANVEPTFKYQIDTFSDNSGGFKPYFLGIYSGISYRL